MKLEEIKNLKSMDLGETLKAIEEVESAYEIIMDLKVDLNAHLRDIRNSIIDDNKPDTERHSFRSRRFNEQMNDKSAPF